MELLIILIRIEAFRFTGNDKRQLLWEAHLLLDKNRSVSSQLFEVPKQDFELPALVHNKIEDAYDEIELLGFPVTMSFFDLLQTNFRGECMAEDLIKSVGKRVRMVGNYVTRKPVQTVRGDMMAFGTFLDTEGKFFDTTNFPPSLKLYPFTGAGAYLILGKVVEEFGFPSLEVDKMVRLPIKKDPRI